MSNEVDLYEVSIPVENMGRSQFDSPLRTIGFMLNGITKSITLPVWNDVVDHFMWVLDNGHIDKLANQSPTFIGLKFEMPSALALGQGHVHRIAWRFSDPAVAVMFKLTWGGQ